MNLEDLKSRATAAELTLIDTVLKLSEEEAAKVIKRRVSDFVIKNLPPHRHDPHFHEERDRWAKRFNEALIGES